MPSTSRGRPFARPIPSRRAERRRHGSGQAARRRGISSWLTLLATAALLFPSWAAAGPTDVDESFGNGGLALDLGGLNSAADLHIQSDGRILVAGVKDDAFGVSRLLPSGALDLAFGDGGIVRTPIGTSSGASSVSVLADGRVVAAGGATVAGQRRFVFARYLADGRLDPTFSEDGIATTTAFGTGSDFLFAAELLPSGGMVGAGTTTGGGVGRIAVVRLLPDGTPDPDFGSGGQATALVGSSVSGRDVAVLPDGDVVVAGGTTLSDDPSDFAVVRFTSDGRLDPDFGTGGIAVIPFGPRQDDAYSVLAQSDGRILVGGSTAPLDRESFDYDFALARLDSDGTLDQGFGTGGRVTTQVGGDYDEITELALAPDGKLIAGGLASEFGGSFVFGLARYLTAGQLDTSFGRDGTFTSALFGSANLGGLAVQSDGRIVAGGSTTDTDTGISNAVLVRYGGDPPNIRPTAELTASPPTVTPFQPVAFDATGSRDEDGRIVEYRWDFDNDGTVDRVTSEAQTTYAYSAQGVFVTRLTVVDDDGETGFPAVVELRVWDGRLDYVALGDSFSAGEGLAPYFTETNYGPNENRCHRSRLAFSRALPLDAVSVTRHFFACSGATTENLADVIQYRGEGVVQLDRPELNAGTDLVTLTVGGNDVGFAEVLGECGDPRNQNVPLTGRDEGDCTEDGRTVQTAEGRIAALSADLDDVFTALAGKVGPTTTVVVAGYPLLFPDAVDEQRCRQLRVEGNFNQDEQNFIRAGAAQLNQVLADAAARHGFYFASVTADFDGHQPCEAGVPYTNAVTYTTAIAGSPMHPRDGTDTRPKVPGDGSFHPTPAGQLAYARVIENFLDAQLAAGARVNPSGLPANP